MESRTQVLQVGRSPRTPEEARMRSAFTWGRWPHSCSVSADAHGVYWVSSVSGLDLATGDKTIVGSITNTNFGVCLDLGRDTE